MENQEIMDQFLENRQNYMMDNNMQHMNNATAGCENVNVGVAENVTGGGVGGEMLGVKYDEQLQHREEHDVGDDDEWKYVKEVQQSEKKQQQSLKSFGLGDDEGSDNSNELADNKIAKGSNEFGKGEGAFVFGGDHLLQHEHQDMFNLDNGHNTNGHEIHQNVEIAPYDEFANIANTEFDGKNPFDNDGMDGFKAEGDFSSISNNTESVEEFVPELDVKIETKPELLQEHQELGDEEEPSSLATNTTNGTSSLSENVPQPASLVPGATAPANAFDDFIATLENKENSDPLTLQRPDVLDIDQAQSLLNPDAKEFVPSFGSNPASPTSPFGSGMQSSDFGEPLETKMYFGEQPSAVPRHFLGTDDDFVAQSPRKGRGDDNNMDSVSLPKELAEFEKEADKRPHELEPDGVDVLQNLDGVMTPDQQIQQLPLDDIVNEKENQDPSSPQDLTDFQPSSFMDHGPETCVDLDADIDMSAPVVLCSSLQTEDDVMKRSMYVASDEAAAIEDVLNSVQPIPTEIDSVNNSFIEESVTESAAVATSANIANDKELLQVEEKEHVSHSPSTEEIQMNLQNTLNSSNKDITQLPVDMDNGNNMQESMYDPILDQHQQDIDPLTINAIAEESLLADTTNPLAVTDDSLLNNSFDAQEETSQQQEIQETFEEIVSHAITSTPGLDTINFDLPEIHEQQQAPSDSLTASSTADEKHLLEETKEQLFSMSTLEQQMNELILNNDDHLSQVEEVAASPAAATTVIDNISEHLISPDVAVNEADQSQQKMLIDESFNAIEQEYLRPQHEQSDPNGEAIYEYIESPIQNQELENEMVAVEEPIFEAKQATPLLNTKETEIVNEPQQQEIPPCMVTETAPAELLEQPPHMDSETEIVKREVENEKPIVVDLSMEVVEEPKQEEVKIENVSAVEEIKDNSIPVAVVAAAAATAAAVVGTKVASSATKKSEPVKKPLSKTTTATTTAKSKVGGISATSTAKKPLDTAKKPIGSLSKPRVALAKSATTSSAAAEKKPMTKPATTTTTARKPLSAAITNTATKPAVKTTTTTSTTRTIARPTTAPRTMTTNTTTRKPVAPATTNGPAAKPRPATAPAKPTSLGLPATNGAAKTKVTSPRATLTSQLRKTAPTTTTTTTAAAAKSPIKSTATNGVSKTATSTLASRTKTTTTSSSTSSTHGTSGTKLFTARPAPKFTASSSSTTTTTTTRRLTVGGNTTAATSTTTTTKTSSAPLRKSSPSKPLAGRTPTKTTTTTAGGLKSKTPQTKMESLPEQRPAPIRKPVDKTIMNGDASISKELNGNPPTTEQQPPQNGDGLQQVVQQQNGDSNIPMQSDVQQQPLLEQRDEQIPMDLINA